jgi:molybdenum cofactor cytidylyltransferase
MSPPALSERNRRNDELELRQHPNSAEFWLCRAGTTEQMTVGGLTEQTCFNARLQPITVRQASGRLDGLTSVLRERGPIFQARPIASRAVAILYTDLVDGQKARQLFRKIMRQRLTRFETCASFVTCSVEPEGATARSLQDVLRLNPTAVLIASTTGLAGPGDVIACEMVRVGCRIERFMAPVVPGNLFLLGYKDDVPIVPAPGCFSSAQRNVVDCMLPPMLARYRISSWEIASLGNGGLLDEVSSADVVGRKMRS